MNFAYEKLLIRSMHEGVAKHILGAKISEIAADRLSPVSVGERRDGCIKSVIFVQKYLTLLNHADEKPSAPSP